MREKVLIQMVVGVVALLLLGGFILLYSAGQTEVETAARNVWRRQLIWLGLGLIGATVAHRMSPRLLEWASRPLYAFSLLLLISLLFFGAGGGTRSWLEIGGLRLGQPAELAKLATIMLLATHLGSKREPPQTLRELIPSGIIVGLPMLLIMAQPDLGSAMVFVGILFGMLFWAGVSPWLLLLVASPLVSLVLAFSTAYWGAWIVAVTLLLLWMRPYVVESLAVWLSNVLMGVVALEVWNGLAPYQQARLLSFLNPEIDPQATGWHLIQSKVAIGSGGILGKGFLEGTQKRLAFLPAQHTDFVFSILGEEFGFLGVVAALGLFGLLVVLLVRIARRATEPFTCLLVFGLATLFFSHIIENVGMTIGLLPITGIPLPFFSYGGSFLVISLISVAIAIRVAWDSRLAGYATI